MAAKVERDQFEVHANTVLHTPTGATFGARPGDFERVKSIGVDEFIRQQLDPDSLDDSALLAKLEKLKTIGMATPLISRSSMYCCGVRPCSRASCSLRRAKVRSAVRSSAAAR